MFTSPVEHRQHLRADNADLRLCHRPPDRLGGGRRISALLSQGMDFGAESAEELVNMEADVEPKGYLQRHGATLGRLAGIEEAAILPESSYREGRDLSRDFVDFPDGVRPEALGQAPRARNVTPTAVAGLGAWSQKTRASRAK